MHVTILLYDRFTALDAIGPYEVLAQLIGGSVEFAAERQGLVANDTGRLRLEASRAIADIDTTDILVVPGGPGDEAVRRNEAVLAWIRRIHERTTWTTSVCTGSLILGAAGLLRGLRATSHWFVLERLREFGAEPVGERVVEQGKIVTAAGVSSGIDMALRLVQHLAGDDVAQAIQLGIEYDPQPPFDAGAPAKAPAHVVAMVRGIFEQLMAARRAPAA